MLFTDMRSKTLVLPASGRGPQLPLPDCIIYGREKSPSHRAGLGWRIVCEPPRYLCISQRPSAASRGPPPSRGCLPSTSWQRGTIRSLHLRALVAPTRTGRGPASGLRARPVYTCADPIRGGGSLLAMCEVFQDVDSTGGAQGGAAGGIPPVPYADSTRAALREALAAPAVAAQKAQAGFAQQARPGAPPASAPGPAPAAGTASRSCL